MGKTITHTETNNDTDSVTLKKDTKGNYNWEIKVYGDKHEDMLDKIKVTDERLTREYPRITGEEKK